MRKHWIGVVSLNHIEIGRKDGFIQLCHGKCAPLKKMNVNDLIFIYSPTVELGSKKKYQCFSAIGKMLDNDVKPFMMTEEFMPFRRNVEFLANHKQLSIHDIKDELDFITDKVRYGAKFRFGHFEISKKNALTLWHAMQLD